MPKLLKSTLLISFLLSFCSISVLAIAQEEISITTYYPSPNGSYNELGTNRLAVDINGVAVPTEFAAMANGDAHIGRSLIIGAGGGSGYAYDEGATTADGSLLVKGNVGIGTTAPATKIHQNNGNATATYHKFTAGTTTGLLSTDGFDVGIDGSGNAELIQRENLPMNFYTNNTNRMTVLANGDIGIGDTTPAAKLEVNGGIRLGTSSTCSSSAQAGTIRYDSGIMQYCNGSGWVSFGGGIGTLTTRSGGSCSVNGSSCTSSIACISPKKTISGGCVFTGDPHVSSTSALNTSTSPHSWTCTANCTGWAVQCGAAATAICAD